MTERVSAPSWRHLVITCTTLILFLGFDIFNLGSLNSRQALDTLNYLLSITDWLMNEA
jgi:hypothetical protein